MTEAEPLSDAGGACRSCGRRALVAVLDLGEQPEANSFPRPGSEAEGEARWPLRVFVCEQCWLVQLDDSGPAEAAIPGPPAYELSETMRAHVAGFADDALARLASSSPPASPGRARVVEMASHGGYIAPFLAELGVDSLIVEGVPDLADAAAARGYRVLGRTFGRCVASEMVAEGGPADLVLDNYLLSHVVDPDDFAAGLAVLLRPGGLAVLELDHLLPLVRDRRFDSIRHGHYSYLGLISVSSLLERHGLAVVDVATQPVYGGALRIFVAEAGDPRPATPAVGAMLEAEHAAGLADRATLEAFATGVADVQSALRGFLEKRRAAGDVVVGYGAPSRGNTLLNSSRINRDLLAYTVDRSSGKHGRLLPGSHIPIHAPERLAETRPAYVLILTWDIRDEVIAQLPEVRSWGGRFVVPLPQFEIVAPG